MMKKLFLPLLSFALVMNAYGQYESDEEVLRALYTTALKENQGYQWLEELCNMGHRLAGSDNATAAVLRFRDIADSLGFKCQLQKVRVPHWERGDKEHAFFVSGGEKTAVNITTLGGSVATAPGGLSAEVVELRSFEELAEMDQELQGKIAFFNIPMDAGFISTFSAYGNAVKQRYVGALEASRKGASGVVVRSLSSSVNPHPHTGSMTYGDAERQIPAVAISTLHAEQLSQRLKEDKKLNFHFEINPRWQDSTYSYNLIADLPGREKPDEYILVGGHIDSWDLGTGAHDDGAGCIHALESAWLLQKLEMLPSRTLRVVFFMNEEFGLNGAREYALQSQKEGVHHVIAMESDAGGFTPRGISMVAADTIVDKIKEWRELLEPYGIHQFSNSGSGADIGLLYRDDLVMIGLRPDSHRYFEVHHSALDVMASVNARELEMGSATFAALIYLLDKYDVIARAPAGKN